MPGCVADCSTVAVSSAGAVVSILPAVGCESKRSAAVVLQHAAHCSGDCTHRVGEKYDTPTASSKSLLSTVG